MNEENRTIQYEVIIKNVTPYPQKSIIAVDVSFYNRT